MTCLLGFIQSTILAKIEPYQTFLNIPQLERQRAADLQTKIKGLEIRNQSLR